MNAGKRNRNISSIIISHGSARHVGIVQSLQAIGRLHDSNPYDCFLDVQQRVVQHRRYLCISSCHVARRKYLLAICDARTCTTLAADVNPLIFDRFRTAGARTYGVFQRPNSSCSPDVAPIFWRFARSCQSDYRMQYVMIGDGEKSRIITRRVATGKIKGHVAIFNKLELSTVEICHPCHV